MNLSVDTGQTWAITEAGLRHVASLTASYDGDAPKPLARTMTIRDGVASIEINGPLLAHESIVSLVFGLATYEGIRADLDLALASPGVRSIELCCDSPGGEVSGASDLANYIYGLRRGPKPIRAFIDGAGASACYWIASAAGEVSCTSTSFVGSIGTRCTLVDTSKAQEMIGIKAYEIVSSQSPSKVIDAAKASDRARVQGRLTDVAQVFIEDVAKFRGVSPSTVVSKFGSGDVLVGKYAVAAGLTNAVESYDAFRSRAPSAPQTAPVLPARKQTTMSQSDHDPAALAAARQLAKDIMREERELVAAGITQEHLKAWRAMGADPDKMIAHLSTLKTIGARR